MFSRFEGWDLEDIGVWQDEENKSKKQRKCHSGFRPEPWPSFLHINIMKLSLPWEALRREERPTFHRIWKRDGEPTEHDSKPQELASPGCSRKWERCLPTSSKAPQELCQHLQGHQHVLKWKPFEFKSPYMPGIPCERRCVPEEIKQKGCESLARAIPLERGDPASHLKRHLAGTGVFEQPLWNSRKLETTRSSIFRRARVNCDIVTEWEWVNCTYTQP